MRRTSEDLFHILLFILAGFRVCRRIVPHFIPLSFPLLYLPFFSFFFPSSSHPLISHFQLNVLVPFSLLKCCLNVILLSSSSPLFLPLQTNKHCTVWTVISSPLLLCTIRVLLLRCVHSHWRSAPHLNTGVKHTADDDDLNKTKHKNHV